MNPNCDPNFMSRIEWLDNTAPMDDGPVSVPAQQKEFQIGRFKVYVTGGLTLWTQQFAVGTDQQDEYLLDIVKAVKGVRKIELVRESNIR